MLDRYLTKRRRSRYWQLRVPVPADLHAAVGKKVVTQSLRECDRTQAERRAVQILAQLHRQWEELRQQPVLATVPPGVPSAHDLDVLIWRLFVQTGEKTAAMKNAQLAANPQDYAGFLARFEAKMPGYARAIAAGKLQRWEDHAARLLTQSGYVVDRASAWFQRFVADFAEATVAAVDQDNRWDRGDFAAQPSSAVVARARGAAAAPQVPGDVPFSQVVADYMHLWKAARQTGKDTNTEQQKLATFRLFGSYWADRPLRQLTPEAVAAFYDQLKLFSPHWSRSPAALTLSWGELAAAYGDRGACLADSTMNRHMATLQMLWAWAGVRGHCAGTNPFEGFFRKIRLGQNGRTYRAWDHAELVRLWTPPPKRQDLVEVMLVGMYTGMRLNEIAALTWGHLRSDTEQGETVPYFQIDAAKTPAGIRQVPVHCALAWLLQRPRGPADQRIWATFNPEGPGRKPGADASREFSRFKAQRGFRDQRDKTFHSFRKNVTRIMERAGVPENEWAQIFGHERGFTYKLYNQDGITLVRKAAIIALISYPDLILPTVAP